MLALLKPDDLDAITYHMYPGFGRSLDLPSLIPQAGWLDFTHQIMAATQRAVQSTAAGRATELWIGETAAAWASGTAGVCNGFISGFWWLDQLGYAASSGHGAMCRQCLVGGNYTLIDQLEGFKPNPDYWSAWIWRQTMGTRMVALTQVMPYEGDFKPGTRGYMSCTPPTAPGYKRGALTFVYINTDAHNASILMYQQVRSLGIFALCSAFHLRHFLTDAPRRPCWAVPLRRERPEPDGAGGQPVGAHPAALPAAAAHRVRAHPIRPQGRRALSGHRPQRQDGMIVMLS